MNDDQYAETIQLQKSTEKLKHVFTSTFLNQKSITFKKLIKTPFMQKFKKSRKIFKKPLNGKMTFSVKICFIQDILCRKAIS